MESALLRYDDGDRPQEPLLRKRTMNTTSQIAIVGANVFPIESLDYEIVENDLLKQDWRSRKKKQIFRYVVLKWALVLLIGVLTGLVGFFNNLAVENIAGLKLLVTGDLMLQERMFETNAYMSNLLACLALLRVEFGEAKVSFSGSRKQIKGFISSRACSPASEERRCFFFWRRLSVPLHRF